jgi:DNA-binding transcriptional LysR family regulator
MFNMAELSCRYHFDARYSLIDMPVAFAALLVIPNLPDFYRQHPGIEIILSSSDRRRNMLHDGWTAY